MCPSFRHSVVAGLAGIALAACGTASVDVGYSVPTSGDEGYDFWQVEGRATTAGIVKLGVAARSKLGEARDQIALAPELSVEMKPGPVVLGARLGVNLLQLDRGNGEWTFGAGSPYFSPLLQFRLGDPVFVFLGGSVEYYLDSGDGPNQLYVGAHLGVGIDL